MLFKSRFTILMAAAAAACLAANGIVAAASQSIVVANPSFEDNSITTDVGYGVINGWTSSDTTHTGVNTSGQVFAQGTNIPDGGQVAFIQSSFSSLYNEYLSQSLSGFTTSEQYWFQVFYSARQGTSPPALLATYGTQTIANVASVPVPNPNYTFLNVPFTPAASSGALTIANNDLTGSDSTLLIDAVAVIQRGPNQVVIANPSFQGSSEDLQLGNGNIGYTSAIAGWTISSNAGNFTGINKSGGLFYNNGIAPDGTKVAFLQTYTPAGSTPTTISQNIGGLVAGNKYELTFYYNARSGTADPLMAVSLGGTTFTPSGGLDVVPVGGANPFYKGQYLYTATGSTALLSFSNINTAASTDSSLLLNDVSLQAVPEPATLGLLGLGAIGLLLTVKRRRMA